MEPVPVVGRDPELSQLQSLFVAACGGTSAAVVIRGEPGVGKTTLLREFCQRARPATLLSATGIESESDIGFASLAELLLPLREHLADLPPYHSDILAGALALGPPVRTDPFAIGVATLSLLAAATERVPIVAAVDDVQWIDHESQRALSFAARRMQAENVLMVCTARDDARIPADFHEIQLAGLDDRATHEFLQHLTEGPVDKQVSDELRRGTGGNPLALVTACRRITADELSGAHPIDRPLPVGDALVDALGEDLGKLHDVSRRALLVTSASHSCSYDIICEALKLLGLGEDALLEAEEHRLIQLGGPKIRFRHPILRSIAYHTSSPADRRAAHAALAAVTGSAAGEQRAWHLAAAAPGPDAEVASLLDAAAQAELDSSGYAAAAAMYKRAADFSTDEQQRVGRLLAAASAAQVAGRGRLALKLLDEALDRPPAPHLRAQAHMLRGFVGVRLGEMERTFRTLQGEAQRIEGPFPEVAAAMLSQAAMQAPVAGQTRLGLDLAERAHELAPSPGTTATLAAMRMYAGQEGDARRLLLEAAPLLVGISIRQPEHAIAVFAALSLAWMHEHDEALRLVDPIIASGRSMIAPGVLPLPLLARAEVHRRRGNWMTAHAEAQQARRLADEMGQRALLPFADAVLGGLEALQGAHDACERHCEGSLTLGSELGIAGMEMFTGAARGMGALGAGRFGDAVAHLEGVRLASEQLEIPSVVIAPWRENLIEAYVCSGRYPEAAELLVEFERRAGEADNAHVSAVLCRCRGQVHRELGDAAFTEAMSWHATAIDPFERARTQLWRGEHLRRTKRRAAAQRELRSAMRTFEQLGARAWAARAAAALRTAGAAVRSRARPAFRELTPQELQVALAVCEGATNREAAAALFISPKTVEYHLGSVYRKLGVRSRTELARRLSRAETHTQEQPFEPQR